MIHSRLLFLDGWRGCAVLGVLFGHFIFAGGINLAYVGVELFFVLSGRLMAEILFVRKTSLFEFFPRRVARIYPALLLFASAAFVVCAISGQWIDLKLYFSAITLTFNYYTIYFSEVRGSGHVLDHVWTLCIEEHLYVFLGAMAAVHRRWRYPLEPILLLIALAFCVNGLIQHLEGLDYRAVYWRSDVRGASILFGATAYLWLRNQRAPSWVPIALSFVGLALSTEAIPTPIQYSVGSGCFASAVALLPNLKGLVRKGLEAPHLLRIGILSYSVYLWQQPFYLASLVVRSKFDLGWVFVPAFLVVAVICGVLSFYLVEQPLRRFLNSRWLAQDEEKLTLNDSIEHGTTEKTAA